jgi:exosortase A
MSGEVAEGLAPRGRLLARREDLTAWTAATVGLAIVAAAAILLYWRAVSGAVVVWYGSTAYNHEFLILPIVGYLLWERRALLAVVSPSPRPAILLLLPAAGLLWLLAYLVGVLEAQQLVLIGSLQLVLLAVLGWPVYNAFRFPFLYLFFLVPTGDFLVPSLQQFTAWFVVAALRLSQIPVFSDGFLISIPNENFYVAEACAGLRFLIATIAFGFLFADFVYRSIGRKAAFIVACVAAPIIANGIRAYGIIVIAYATDGQLAAGVDHILYGWIFFSIVTVALMIVGWRFRDAQGAAELPAAGPRAGAASPARIALVAAVALCLLAAPRAYAAFLERATAPGAAGQLAAPAVAAPWAADASPGSWRPSFPGADRTLLQSYRSGGRSVRLFIAYYFDQNQDKKLISFANRLETRQDWDIVDRGTVTIPVGTESLSFAVSQFAAPGQRRLVYSTNWVNGQFEMSDIKAKLLQAKAAFTGGGRAAALVAFTTEVTGDQAEARAALADFAAHLPTLRATLREAAPH